MEMITIDPQRSSTIAQIGHDAQTTCGVLFRRGGYYEHGNVDAEFFSQFANAPEPGKFYQANLRGRQPYRKVGDGVPANVTPINQKAEMDSGLPSAADLDAVAAEQQIALATSKPVEAPLAPEVEKVAEQSSALVQNAVSIQVTDSDTQTKASDMLLSVAAMIGQIESTFEPMKAAAYKAHRVICEQETKLKNPLVEAQKALKKQIGEFVLEQQRIAQKQQDDLRAEEMERARLASVAEGQDLAIQDAVELEAQGNIEAAEAVLANPAPAPLRYTAPASVAPAVAQVSGVTIRTDWDFRVVNEKLIPREYLLVNEAALGSLAKTTKGKATVSGVEFFPKPVVSSSKSKCA